MDRITDLERRYVLEVLDGQFRTSAGSSMTRRLEEKFAATFGCEYAISFINGTATMHAALAAAGIGPGDEVIVPPLTMASTAFAVLHAGAVPVFADIDPGHLDPRPGIGRRRGHAAHARDHPRRHLRAVAGHGSSDGAGRPPWPLRAGR